MGSADTKEHPRRAANPLSLLIFWWTRSLFERGRCRSPLEAEDLHHCPEKDRCSRLGDLLETAWEAELRRRKPSLLRALLRVFWVRLLFSGILLALYALGVTLVVPPLLGRMVEHFAEKAPRHGASEAEAAAGATAVCVFLQAFLLPHGFLVAQAAGVRARAACATLLYRKALRLGAGQLRPGASGALVTLLAADAARIPTAFQRGHFLWLGPAHAVAAAAMLYQQAGWSAVCSAAALLLCTGPLQAVLGRVLTRLGLRVGPLADERLRLLGEVLGNIRAIKMAAWEDAFEQQLLQARRSEERCQRPARAVGVVFLSMLLFSIHLASVAFFTASTLLGWRPEIQHIMIMMQHMYFLNIALNLYFPRAASAVSDGLVSVRRIKEYLLREERPEPAVATKSEALGLSPGVLPGQVIKMSPSTPPLLRGAVLLRDADVCWAQGTPAVLRALRLRLAPGQLCAIVGPVGSGKTALLLALAGELWAGGGDAGAAASCVAGRVSLAAQGAWAWGGGSVRDNVLLGRPLRPQRYARVLSACCLRRDLRRFPRGDDSPVGERGSALSGGQRARLSLARAVYEEADVYLLDDPLAAVDARVARCLFERCVAGLLRGATRLLVTHNPHFAQRADLVVTIDRSTVSVAEGDGWRRGGDGTEDEGDGAESEDEDALAKAREAAVVLTDARTATKATQTEQTAADLEAERAAAEAAAVAAAQQAGSTFAKAKGVLGLVWYFLKAARSPWLLALTAALFLIGQITRSAVDLWVGNWQAVEGTVVEAAGEAGAEEARRAHLGVFVGAVAVLAVLAYARAFALDSVCARAASRLHDSALRSALRAPLSVYEQRPQGELLGPFSADVAVLDGGLPTGVSWCMQIALVLTGLFTVVITSEWRTVFPVALFVVAAGFAMGKLSLVPKKYKQLEARCMEPVISHVSETLEGLVTIRSLQRQHMFKEIFEARQDVVTTACIAFDTTNTVINFIINLLVAMLVSGNMLVFFLSNTGHNAAALGLVFYLSLSVSAILHHLVDNAVEVLGHVGAVARLREMQALPQEEDPAQNDEASLPADWPSPADVEFRDVQLRYGATGALALRGLSFRVRSGHKVGVVGRTGAGKSSLLAALLRLAPLAGGQVRVGGADCARLRMRTVRRAIAVVPQEPALFSGPLRRSLDPEGALPDAALWEALDARRPATAAVRGARAAAPLPPARAGRGHGQRGPARRRPAAGCAAQAVRRVHRAHGGSPPAHRGRLRPRARARRRTPRRVRRSAHAAAGPRRRLLADGERSGDRHGGLGAPRSRGGLETEAELRPRDRRRILSARLSLRQRLVAAGFRSRPFRRRPPFCPPPRPTALRAQRSTSLLHYSALVCRRDVELYGEGN